MKSNPGGQLPVSEIIGRDDFVRRLWDIIARQSLVLTAERRMGKTHIVKKMGSSPSRVGKNSMKKGLSTREI
jgi:hypothetical protein